MALALGVAPLRAAVRVPPGFALKASGSGVTQDHGRFRSGQTVVALQIALCLMLLVGAGLLVRTLCNLENADLGFRASGLLVRIDMTYVRQDFSVMQKVKDADPWPQQQRWRTPPRERGTSSSGKRA